MQQMFQNFNSCLVFKRVLAVAYLFLAFLGCCHQTSTVRDQRNSLTCLRHDCNFSSNTMQVSYCQISQIFKILTTNICLQAAGLQKNSFIITKFYLMIIHFILALLFMELPYIYCFRFQVLMSLHYAFFKVCAF